MDGREAPQSGLNLAHSASITLTYQASCGPPGPIDTDLRNLTRSLVRMLASPTGRALFAAMLSASHIPEIAKLKHRFLDDRIRRAEPVIRGAIQRGELPTDTDPAELVKAVIAPVYLRLLGAEALDVTVADRAARAALAAARAGVLSRSN